MAEGLADHALKAAIGPGWPSWAQEIYADLGLRFDADRATRVSAGQPPTCRRCARTRHCCCTTRVAARTTRRPTCNAGCSPHPNGPGRCCGS